MTKVSYRVRVVPALISPMCPFGNVRHLVEAGTTLDEATLTYFRMRAAHPFYRFRIERTTVEIIDLGEPAKTDI